MSDIAISVENLSKRYIIGHQRSKGDGIRHVIEDAVRAPLRWLRQRREQNSTEREEFWALKDLSFEIKRGEVVGIIGRNGAGKSTLLKVLSRITEPTSGRIQIDGRVASLLEVGTGFHPELTGRENIFLNGAILGMSRVEIKQKFDEIVAFSEVEKFLDTPVKRYSSGMYVRLAFAVAAHLEPEILIVDEVLAVGDAQFQKKCLGKIQDVSANQGRTVLFVSHQIDSVTRLCKKALWLNQGKLHQYGPAEAVCHGYMALGSVAGTQRNWPPGARAPGNEWARLESVEVRTKEGRNDLFEINKEIQLRAVYSVLQNGKILIPNAHFFAENGTLIFISHDWFSGWKDRPRLKGRYETIFTIPGNFLSEGRVVVKLAVSTYLPFQVHFEEPDVVAFTVVEAEEGETSRGDYAGHLPGIVRPIIPIETRIL